MQAEFDRRVYRREFESLLGCQKTWFRKLLDRGTIPRGLCDPGGRREWWPASQVKAILEQMQRRAKQAQPAPPLRVPNKSYKRVRAHDARGVRG
jgi:hypothetical protein